MEKNKADSPIGNLVFGIIMLAAGVGAYFWFAHLETEGESVRIHFLVALAYNWFGKLGVLALLSGFGLLFIVLGVRGRMAQQQRSL